MAVCDYIPTFSRSIGDNKGRVDFYRPGRLLRQYVRYYYVLRTDECFSALTFPVGCTQMIFHKRVPLFVSELNSRQSRFTISGQVDFPAHLRSDGDTEMIVVVFYPYTIGMFIGTAPFSPKISSQTFLRFSISLSSIEIKITPSSVSKSLTTFRRG